MTNRSPLEFDHPEELRVIDPACGSGHFLLYAFDMLERIWCTETDLDRSEIPAEILNTTCTASTSICDPASWRRSICI